MEKSAKKEGLKDILSRFEIPNLGEYREVIIVFITVISASFFFYQYIYLGKVTKIKGLNSQIQEIISDTDRITVEMGKTQETAERLKEIIDRVKDMEERFTITQNKLPSDKQLSSILKGIIGDDVKMGVKFTSVTPSVPEPVGEYFRLPFQINMQAKFQAFGEYLEKTEDSPRIITIENFRIDTEEAEKSLRSIQLYMSAYVLGRQQ